MGNQCWSPWSLLQEISLCFTVQTGLQLAPCIFSILSLLKNDEHLLRHATSNKLCPDQMLPQAAEPSLHAQIQNTDWAHRKLTWTHLSWTFLATRGFMSKMPDHHQQVFEGGKWQTQKSKGSAENQEPTHPPSRLPTVSPDSPSQQLCFRN